jgi:hypothetical protein
VNSHPLVDALVKRWREQGVLSWEVASSEQIERFEKREHVTLPEDFKTYLQLANGTGGSGGCDVDNVLAFWTIDEIEEYEFTKNLYVFADYMQKSWSYAIALGDNIYTDGSIFRVGNPTHIPVQIVSSFTEFIALYFEDVDSLIFPTS